MSSDTPHRPIEVQPAEIGLNIEQIKADFPILEERVNGNRLVYLDNAATTQKPRLVINALIDYYRKINSNIHRGLHTLAERSTEGVRTDPRACRAIYRRGRCRRSDLHQRNDRSAQPHRLLLG